MTLAAQFAEAYQRSDATPERLAFEIARMAYPALDVEEQLNQLDVLAEFVQRELPGGVRGTALGPAKIRVNCRRPTLCA